MKKNIWDISLLILLMLAFLTACENKEWSEDYDIEWPVSRISELSTTDASIEETITIVGTELDKVKDVLIGTTVCEVDTTLENNASQLSFKIPRRVKSGLVSVRNQFDRTFIYEDKPLTIHYPKTIVTKWPTSITAGETFKIEGENVDLITSVFVDGDEVVIRPSDNTNSISVPTVDLKLLTGNTIKISVVAMGGIEGLDETSGVLVEEPTDTFEAVEPIILWTFEDDEPLVTKASDVAPDVAELNYGGLVAPRGENYYSVLKSATGGWTNFSYIVKEGPFDLSEFHEPHITMMVNTNGKKGYINPFMTQNGEEKDNHLNSETANDHMKYGDNYMIETSGWEWRSYPISKLFPDFNEKGIFEEISMRFTSGNVGNGDDPEDFEIHVDQIMITDGLQLPVHMVFDFEGEAPDWEDEGVATPQVVNDTPLGGFAKYYQLKFTSPEAWKWVGAIAVYDEFDLTGISDPHVSFLLNTNGNKGFFQFETYQNEVKWGGAFPNVYEFTTDGWVSMSIRLSDLLTDNWGGDGSADAFDPTKPMDYFKLGFTTGNIDTGMEFEVNIDDIYISDGPMW